MLKIYTLKGVKANATFVEVNYVTNSLNKITKLVNDLKFCDVDIYIDDCNYIFSYVNGKHIVKEIF